MTAHIENFEAKVSCRLPIRPRFRLEGYSTRTGKPIVIDLLPSFDEYGQVVPNWWVLPSYKSSAGKWETVYASSEAMFRRAAANGLTARILN